MAREGLDLDAIEKKIARSRTPVLLKVGAEWCVFCKDLDKALADVLPDFGERILFLEYDATDREDTLTKLGAKSLPLMIVLKDAEETERVVGAISRRDIRKLIERALGE